MARTIQITKTVYSIEDLINNIEYIDIKQKALEKHYNINTDYNWYEGVYEAKTEELKEFGFDVEKIMFCGFASQGDGAMFEGQFYLTCSSNIDLIKSYIKNDRITKLIKNGLITIKVDFHHSGHYYHHKSYKYSFDIEHDGSKYSIEDYPNIYSTLNNLEDEITSNYETKCKEIYKSLEKSYDYLTSEKVIIETFQANEYEFDEFGNII